MRFMAIAAAAAFIAAAAPASAKPAPGPALQDLLTAERQFSAKAANTAPADGIAAMLADDAYMPSRQGMLRGRSAARAYLSGSPASKGTGASWHPIRAGVSADGRHGFTLGYLDLVGGDPKTAHRRYLSYWVKGADGWRVAAFKQVIRPADETDAAEQRPMLPAQLKAPTPKLVPRHKASLVAAEKAFSDRAQVVGIWQAFQENGRTDAIHIAGEKGLVLGLKAIGEAQARQPKGPANIDWSADDAIVASSGDLGVTIGEIRLHGDRPAGAPASVPFFTIWARDNPAQPWRYIAE